MSAIIDEFRQDHARIGAALEEVKQQGIGSVGGRQALFSARQTLLDHLEKENRVLYPVLRRHAQNDPGLQRLLADFASEMEQVAAMAVGFFDKYTASSSGLDFARDFGRLAAGLGRRITREENLLYPEYERRGG